MQNHFHIFVCQKTEQSSITSFISSLLNSYSKSINKLYKRSGTLFEAKTKNKLVEDETYFKWIIKYIVENPVKAGIVNDCCEWEFSNARDLFGLRGGTLTNVNEVKSFFDSTGQMKEFLTDREIKSLYEI
jgi:putative transposase